MRARRKRFTIWLDDDEKARAYRLAAYIGDFTLADLFRQLLALAAHRIPPSFDVSHGDGEKADAPPSRESFSRPRRFTLYMSAKERKRAGRVAAYHGLGLTDVVQLVLFESERAMLEEQLASNERNRSVLKNKSRASPPPAAGRHLRLVKPMPEGAGASSGGVHIDFRPKPT